MKQEAACIVRAVERCIAEGILTEDLSSGSSYGTIEVGDAVARFILEDVPVRAKSY